MNELRNEGIVKGDTFKKQTGMFQVVTAAVWKKRKKYMVIIFADDFKSNSI